MFAGIVEGKARVALLETKQSPFRLELETEIDFSETSLGDSICISGVCLTVIHFEQQETTWRLAFELAEETLRRSILGDLSEGSEVNIERSLKVGDRIHGHFVSGHVDAKVALKDKLVEETGVRYEWELPVAYAPFVAEKGSVSLSGVSLTVGEVTSDSFFTYLIPHTEKVTVLGSLKPGDSCNFEVDMLARYVLRQRSLEEQTAQGGAGS